MAVDSLPASRRRDTSSFNAGDAVSDVHNADFTRDVGGEDFREDRIAARGLGFTSFGSNGGNNGLSSAFGGLGQRTGFGSAFGNTFGGNGRNIVPGSNGGRIPAGSGGVPGGNGGRIPVNGGGRGGPVPGKGNGAVGGGARGKGNGGNNNGGQVGTGNNNNRGQRGGNAGNANGNGRGAANGNVPFPTPIAQPVPVPVVINPAGGPTPTAAAAAAGQQEAFRTISFTATSLISQPTDRPVAVAGGSISLEPIAVTPAATDPTPPIEKDPNPTSAADTKDPFRSPLTLGGTIVGSLAGLAIIVFFVLFIRRWRLQRAKNRISVDFVPDTFSVNFGNSGLSTIEGGQQDEKVDYGRFDIVQPAYMPSVIRQPSQRSQRSQRSYQRPVDPASLYKISAPMPAPDPFWDPTEILPPPATRRFIDSPQPRSDSSLDMSSGTEMSEPFSQLASPLSQIPRQNPFVDPGPQAISPEIVPQIPQIVSPEPVMKRSGSVRSRSGNSPTKRIREFPSPQALSPVGNLPTNQIKESPSPQVLSPVSARNETPQGGQTTTDSEIEREDVIQQAKVSTTSSGTLYRVGSIGISSIQSEQLSSILSTFGADVPPVPNLRESDLNPRESGQPF